MTVMSNQLVAELGSELGDSGFETAGGKADRDERTERHDEEDYADRTEEPSDVVGVDEPGDRILYAVEAVDGGEDQLLDSFPERERRRDGFEAAGNG